MPSVNNSQSRTNPSELSGAWHESTARRVFDPLQAVPQKAPIEAGTGVALASWRHVLVTRGAFDRIARSQVCNDRRKHVVLRRFEGLSFETLEFDADRVVVATRLAAPHRRTGMPGARVARNELQ